MDTVKTSIPDLFIVKPKVFEDNRGFFYESYNKEVFSKIGLDYTFVQDNHSKSKRGVLRGMHYQLGPMAQAKLVSVLSGKVLDVVVDIRKGSPTFGKWEAVELSSENKLSLMIPRGFAHGFLVLSETAEFFYKCDNFYSKEHEAGFKFDDPEVNIDWGNEVNNYILSDKDQLLPEFKKAAINFQY